MAFHCKHCGAVFPSKQGRPRCPSCLRMTTVVEVADPVSPPPGAGTPSAEAGVVGGSPGRERRAASPPGRERRAASPPGRGLSRPPVAVWVGAALLGATTIAVFSTSFDGMEDGERLGAAAAYAALGGAGFAVALRGFLKWRPWQ